MNSERESNRRDVLRVALGAGIVTSTAGGATQKDGIPYRTLGHTGVRVSCIGMGGFHLAKKEVSEADAMNLMRTGVDRGINFFDNSWDYNNGESEKRMGKAMKEGGLRDRVFLMTKNDGRTKDEFNKQLDESLRRLQTDHVDLIQFHEIIRFEDPNRIFAEGGAAEAALEAKKAGKVRFIGFTGHKDPNIHLYMLRVADAHHFQFDTVQMPVNVMDYHYRSFTHDVLPHLTKRNLGVLGMKSLGDGVILKSGVVTALECLQFSLSRPVSVQITGIDSPKILDQAIKAAQTYDKVTKEKMATVLERTKTKAMGGEWELFKTSELFDSTAKHPEWLGGASDHVKKVQPPMS
jgi:aryl-alcohol dehydrogenase-like predicted oxidoreductase